MPHAQPTERENTIIEELIDAILPHFMKAVKEAMDSTSHAVIEGHYDAALSIAECLPPDEVKLFRKLAEIHGLQAAKERKNTFPIADIEAVFKKHDYSNTTPSKEELVRMAIEELSSRIPDSLRKIVVKSAATDFLYTDDYLGSKCVVIPQNNIPYDPSQDTRGTTERSGMF